MSYRLSFRVIIIKLLNYLHYDFYFISFIHKTELRFFSVWVELNELILSIRKIAILENLQKGSVKSQVYNLIFNKISSLFGCYN